MRPSSVDRRFSCVDGSAALLRGRDDDAGKSSVMPPGGRNTLRPSRLETVRAAFGRRAPRATWVHRVRIGAAGVAGARLCAGPRQEWRGRAISLRNGGMVMGFTDVSAREVPAPPSAWGVRTGPAAGSAATRAALPYGITRFHFGTVAREGRTCCGRTPSTFLYLYAVDSSTSRSDNGIWRFLQQRSQRAQRLCERCVLCGPQDLIAEAMTFSQMTILSMDEILLRTEISGMGGSHYWSPDRLNATRDRLTAP